MSDLYCSMLNIDLNAELYNAACAGLGFGIGTTSTSVEIGVSGFASKLTELLITVVEKAKAFKVDATQLLVYMAKYKQAYGNVVNSKPLGLCYMYMGYINSSSAWHYKLLDSELSKVTPEKLQEHINSLFDVTFTKMVMVGNFDE
ncbi:metalloprotease, partial [Coemansia sp. BCRC 34301]